MQMLIKMVPSKTILYGDLNSDGKVTIADALKLARFKNGLVELTEAQKHIADVNCDGKLDDDDISLISKYETKLIDVLPVNQ